MSGKTGTPVCPISQGGLYECILAGVCTGNPLSHTHVQSCTQMNISHSHMLLCAHTSWWQKRHYLKWNISRRCLTELIDCDEPIPACLDAFSFPFPYLSLYLHKDNLKKSTQLGICSVWFINHKSLKISPSWCMAYCYYKYANLENPRWEYLIYNLLLYNYHFTIHSIWYLWW